MGDQGLGTAQVTGRASRPSPRGLRAQEHQRMTAPPSPSFVPFPQMTSSVGTSSNSSLADADAAYQVLASTLEDDTPLLLSSGRHPSVALLTSTASMGATPLLSQPAPQRDPPVVALKLDR
eukprot:3427113-Amphidinium_carterae.3